MIYKALNTFIDDRACLSPEVYDLSLSLSVRVCRGGVDACMCVSVWAPPPSLCLLRIRSRPFRSFTTQYGINLSHHTRSPLCSQPPPRQPCVHCSVCLHHQDADHAPPLVLPRRHHLLHHALPTVRALGPTLRLFTLLLGIRCPIVWDRHPPVTLNTHAVAKR
jgi:hypothetical protein